MSKKHYGNEIIENNEPLQPFGKMAGSGSGTP